MAIFSEDLNLDTTAERDMVAAFRTQLKLGWESLLHGLIAKELIKQQQQYYSSMHLENLAQDGASD